MFFNFFKRDKTVICIDIGYRNIKVVEVKLNKDLKIFINNYGIVKTPTDCIYNGQIIDVPTVVKEINNIITSEKMKGKESKIIMSGTNIITNIFVVDSLQGDTLDNAIMKKIDEQSEIALNKRDYRIDYKHLQTIRDGNKMKYKVFATAVPHVVLQSYVKVLNGLKLKPLAIDIPGNSVAKFFERTIEWNDTDPLNLNNPSQKTKNSIFAVLDFGSETTIVNVLKNRLLEFNKVILQGSSNIDKIIQKEMDVTLAEAERLKRTYGLKVPDEDSPEEHKVVYKLTYVFVEKLIEQVEAYLDEYQNDSGEDAINKIYTIGGGSQLLGLQHYMYSTMKAPVSSVNLLDLKDISMRKDLAKDKLNFLINSTGISL